MNLMLKLSKYYDSSDYNKIKVATSIENLDPDSPVIKAINELPIDPGAKLHSIVGSENGREGEGSTDGVVPYSSSHLEKAESELTIRSGHNVQTTPECAREIKRILIENLK